MKRDGAVYIKSVRVRHRRDARNAMHFCLISEKGRCMTDYSYFMVAAPRTSAVRVFGKSMHTFALAGLFPWRGCGLRKFSSICCAKASRRPATR